MPVDTDENRMTLSEQSEGEGISGESSACSERLDIKSDASQQLNHNNETEFLFRSYMFIILLWPKLLPKG